MRQLDARGEARRQAVERQRDLALAVERVGCSSRRGRRRSGAARQRAGAELAQARARAPAPWARAGRCGQRQGIRARAARIRDLRVVLDSRRTRAASGSAPAPGGGSPARPALRQRGAISSQPPGRARLPPTSTASARGPKAATCELKPWARPPAGRAGAPLRARRAGEPAAGRQRLRHAQRLLRLNQRAGPIAGIVQHARCAGRRPARTETSGPPARRAPSTPDAAAARRPSARVSHCASEISRAGTAPPRRRARSALGSGPMAKQRRRRGCAAPRADAAKARLRRFPPPPALRRARSSARWGQHSTAPQLPERGTCRRPPALARIGGPPAVAAPAPRRRCAVPGAGRCAVHQHSRWPAAPAAPAQASRADFAHAVGRMQDFAQRRLRPAAARQRGVERCVAGGNGVGTGARGRAASFPQPAPVQQRFQHHG